MSGEYRSATKIFVLALVLALVAIVVVSLVVGALQIPLMNIQRQAIEQSPQFSASKRAALADYQSSYLKLETEKRKTDDPDLKKSIGAQESYIIDQMCAELAETPRSSRPQETQSFLDSVGGC